MMKAVVAIFLAACVAIGAATECNDLTIIKVKSQWYRAYSHGNSRVHFAEAVFRTFFNLEPEFNEKFRIFDLSSGKFRAFALNGLAEIEMAITFLDSQDALAATLNYAHAKHVQKQVPHSYIDSFFKAIGHVAPAQLGRCFDKEAWKACFTVIGNGIKNGVPEVAHH